MRRTERIHFYEYMDIIDSRNKLEELKTRVYFIALDEYTKSKI